MSSAPGETPVKFSTSATSIGSATAGDPSAIAPQTARAASAAWPTNLAENQDIAPELLAMTGLPCLWVCPPRNSDICHLPQPLGSRCDANHKKSFFRRAGRTEVGLRTTIFNWGWWPASRYARQWLVAVSAGL